MLPLGDNKLMNNVKPKNPPALASSGDGRNGERIVNAEKDVKNFVKNCPYRLKSIPNPCESVPENFYCNTPDCWKLSEKASLIDVTKLSDEDLQEFMKAMHLVMPNAISRIHEHQMKQHNRIEAKALKRKKKL